MSERPGRRLDISANSFAFMVFLTSMTAMGSVSISTYLPAMQDIADDLGASLAEVQGTLSAYLLGYAAGNLVHGPISDRFGRKPVLVANMGLYLLASAAAVFAATIEQIWALRVLQGLVACAGPVLGRAIIRDTYEGAQLTRAFSLLSLAMGIAPALGPMLGGLLMTWFEWRAAFTFMALYSALIILVALPAFRESLPPPVCNGTRPPRMRTTIVTILRNRIFVGWALSLALANAGWFIFMTVSPFVLMGRLGVSPAEFGVLSVVPIGGYLAGSLLQHHVLQTRSRQLRVAVGFGFTLGAPLILLITSFDLSVAGVVGPMFLYMIGHGVNTPNHMTFAMEPFPQVAGTASTLLGFAMLSTGAAASFIAGLIYQDGMIEPTLGIIGFSLAGGLVVAAARPWRAG